MRRYSTAAIFLLLAACISERPSTRIQSVSKDPSFNPQSVRHALVLGVIPNLERRQRFEEALAGALQKRGWTADPSYRVWPSLDRLTRPTIEAYVKEKHVEVVSITRLADKKTIEADVPDHVTHVPASPIEGAGSYFEYSEKAMKSPGYTVEQSVAVLETKLFDALTGKNVWTGRSETLINGYLDDLLRSYADVVTKALYDSK